MSGRAFAVVLLDIDGTLVHAGGAGRRSISRALVEHCGATNGAAEALARIRLDGMTDRLIVREGFELLGHPFDEAACDAVLARYVAHLERELTACPDAPARPGFAVLPGVEAALAGLSERGRAFGLCTGNVVEGARHKLRRGGLERFFEWHPEAIGGFAHDGEARHLVVAAAVRRASARLGRTVAPAECLVVGDTPRDVEAAHAVGCPTLAVATGNYGLAALAAAGAERVVPGLDHPEAVAWLLG